MEHRVRFELTRTCVTGLANRRLRPLGYLCKLERVGGIEPPSPAWKAGALPLSYTRGKGCWPCHSTGRRADRDYQGFGAPPPILVLRFTLLGAGNPQHCPNQHKAATGLRSPSAYGFRCSGNGFVLTLPLLPGGRFRALTNRKQRPCIAFCVAKRTWRIGCWWPESNRRRLCSVTGAPASSSTN